MSHDAKVTDFKKGDRVEYVGASEFSPYRSGTVFHDGDLLDRYVHVQWDNATYQYNGDWSNAFPHNIRKVVPAVTDPNVDFAATLRKMATAAREQAKAQNRIAEKAEALAREIESTSA